MGLFRAYVVVKNQKYLCGQSDSQQMARAIGVMNLFIKLATKINRDELISCLQLTDEPGEFKNFGELAEF